MSASAYDLCTVADVIRYAPGYEPDQETGGDQTVAVLQRMITAESVTQLDRGREFVALAEGDRSFPITPAASRRRIVRIGDAAEVTGVTIVDQAGATVQAVADAAWTALPRNRAPWQPVERIEFPAGAAIPAELGCGAYLAVVEATWGFPEVPADVVEAVAQLVLVGYASTYDTGALVEAVADVNLSQMQASALEVLGRYASPAIA